MSILPSNISNHRMSHAVPAMALLIFLVMLLLLTWNGSPAQALTNDVNSNVAPISGSGSSSDPYVYTIGSNATLSWPYLNEIGGFDDEGNQTGQTGALLLRNLAGGDGGRLCYSWFFEGSGRSFITDELKGPYSLSMALSSTSDVNTCLLKLGTSREIYGSATLVVDMQDYFKPGDVLKITYAGGDPTADYHGGGSANLPASDTVLGNCTVNSDGYISFAISYGGSFKFTCTSRDLSQVDSKQTDNGGTNNQSSGQTTGTGTGNGTGNSEGGSSEGGSSGTGIAFGESGNAASSQDGVTGTVQTSADGTATGSSAKVYSAELASAQSSDSSSDTQDDGSGGMSSYILPLAALDTLMGFGFMLWMFRKELG